MHLCMYQSPLEISARHEHRVITGSWKLEQEEIWEGYCSIRENVLTPVS